MPSTTDPSDPEQPDDSERPTCHECDATVDADANFCSTCGTDLNAGRRPEYCRKCGDQFAPDDAFCSGCGADRSASETGAARSSTDGSNDEPHDPTSTPDDPTSTPDKSAFRRRVRHHLDAGWEVKRDEGHTVTLVDRDIGSIPIHVLLLPTTGGVGNLLYGYYHHSTLAETRRLSVDDEHYPMPKRDPDEESSLTTASAYALSAFVLLIGLFIAFVAVRGGSIAMAGVGLVLALAGLLVAPPVDNRLDRRHRITAFGRRKTVDHRVLEPVDPVEEPCVVCDREFHGGVVRRRRDETLVAGVPVRTHEYETNHYCAACAREDLFGTDGPAAPSTDVEASLDEAVGEPVDGAVDETVDGAVDEAGTIGGRDPVSETTTDGE